jgi:hypothetical protein
MKISITVNDTLAQAIKQNTSLDTTRLKALAELREAEAGLKNEEGRTVRGGKARLIAAKATYESIAKLYQESIQQVRHMVNEQVNVTRIKHISESLSEMEGVLPAAAAISLSTNSVTEFQFDGHTLHCRATWTDYSGVCIEVGDDRWTSWFTIRREKESGFDFTRQERRDTLLVLNSPTEIEFTEEARDGAYTVQCRSLQDDCLAAFRFKLSLANKMAAIAEQLAEKSYANAIALTSWKFAESITVADKSAEVAA